MAWHEQLRHDLLGPLLGAGRNRPEHPESDAWVALAIGRMLQRLLGDDEPPADLGGSRRMRD
jgi:hypothetical protein